MSGNMNILNTVSILLQWLQNREETMEYTTIDPISKKLALIVRELINKLLKEMGSPSRLAFIDRGGMVERWFIL